MIVKAIQQTIIPGDPKKWRDLYDQRQDNTLVLKALDDFIKFTDEYNQFLDELLQTLNFDAEETTPDLLRDRFLQALNEYWTPLGQVAMQRLIPFYRDSLDKATRSAQKHLKQLDLNLEGALVYFNKVTSIRYYPYSDIAFLGIPYAQTLVGESDWMSIPHELGHYLYWNYLGRQEQTDQPANSLDLVRTNQKIIQDDAYRAVQNSYNRSKDSRDNVIEQILFAWTEEIFCDIVGTVLAGETFVGSLRNLIKARAGNKRDLVLNDGVHPPFCLRPFVREIAIQQISSSDEPVADWNNFFQQQFGVADPFDLELVVLSPDARELLESLDKNELLQLLGAEQPFSEMDLPHLRLPARDFYPSLEILVKQLVGQFEQISFKAQTHPAPEISRFAELLDVAKKEAEIQERPLHEIIFAPRILEGGEQHSHNAVAHWTTHIIGTHNH